MDKFGLYTLHARKISNVGVYNMVHVFPHIRSFTCWEPQFDIADMNYFSHLSQVRKIYSFEKSLAISRKIVKLRCKLLFFLANSSPC